MEEVQVQEAEVQAPAFTAVQEKRHAARELAARAVRTLAGVTGLSQDEQVSRLTHAQELFAEAAEVVAQALSIAAERDYTEYQKTKHQGVDGWLTHVVTIHDMPESELKGLLASMGAEATPENLSEVAYQIHKEFLEHAH